MHEIQQVFTHRIACPHIFSLLDKFLQHKYVLWNRHRKQICKLVNIWYDTLIA